MCWLHNVIPKIIQKTSIIHQWDVKLKPTSQAQYCENRSSQAAELRRTRTVPLSHPSQSQFTSCRNPKGFSPLIWNCGNSDKPHTDYFTAHFDCPIFTELAIKPRPKVVWSIVQLKKKYNHISRWIINE